MSTGMGRWFRDIGWNLDEKKWLEGKSYIESDCSYTPLTRDPDRLEMVDEGVRIRWNRALIEPHL